MARFYANENLPEPVVVELRRHFVRLHLERPAHAGIVVCTFDTDFSGLARRIHEAVQVTPAVVRTTRANQPSLLIACGA
jgi:hypothetical protein